MEEQYSRALKEYQWLADMYMVDFIVEDQWRQLPADWQHYFEQRIAAYGDDKSRLVGLVRDIVLHDRPMPGAPLSFAAMKKAVRTLSLRDEPISAPSEVVGRMGVEVNETSNAFTDLMKVLPPRLRTRMKAKKLHEFGRICDVIRAVMEQTEVGKKVDGLVDIGAGVGHLSRVLSLLLERDVATIEGDEKLVERALAMDNRFKRIIDGKTPSATSGSWRAPERKTIFLKEHSEIDEAQASADGSSSLLIGVHTCGDLSAVVLRHFAFNPDASVLLQFGCCYHKLLGGTDKLYRDVYADVAEYERASKGFPMSNAFDDFRLSYPARELACFGREQFLQRLQESTHHHILFVNCYRAILEWLILGCPPRDVDRAKIDPSLRHQGLRGVKGAENMDFWQYAEETLKGKPDLMAKVVDMKENDRIRDQVDEFLRVDGPKILIVYALRLMVAPLIETIILRDRHAFLEENGCRAELVPLFDPALSPRNIAVLAWKP